MNIAAFPKAYLEDIARNRTMTVFEWIELSRQLDADGLEMYDGFFTSLSPSYIGRVGEAITNAGYVMPMMCCSPDFTNPNADERKRALEHEIEMIQITRWLGTPRVTCRVLTGQRYPEVSMEQGLEWVVEAIDALIPVAREYNVILALENHYKDGHWKYAEFAQKRDVFLALLHAIPEKEFFGVQYDPSNAIVAGDDPVDLLRRVAERVVSMHASDRYLKAGTLEDLRQTDGTLGYSPNLSHGVIGEGLNDYDAIFSILAQVGYNGWVSIEDGVNGMDEMQKSIHFLRQMSTKYFS